MGLTATLISTAIYYYPVSLIFATKHHTCGTVHSEFQNHHKKGKFKSGKYRSLYRAFKEISHHSPSCNRKIISQGPRPSAAAPALEVKKNWFSGVSFPAPLTLAWGPFPTGPAIDLETPFLTFHDFTRRWVAQPWTLLSVFSGKKHTRRAFEHLLRPARPLTSGHRRPLR